MGEERAGEREESNSEPCPGGQLRHTLTADTPFPEAREPRAELLRTQFCPNSPISIVSAEEVALGSGSPTAAVGLGLGQQVTE